MGQSQGVPERGPPLWDIRGMPDGSGSDDSADIRGQDG